MWGPLQLDFEEGSLCHGARTGAPRQLTVPIPTFVQPPPSDYSASSSFHPYQLHQAPPSPPRLQQLPQPHPRLFHLVCDVAGQGGAPPPPSRPPAHPARGSSGNRSSSSSSSSSSHCRVLMRTNIMISNETNLELQLGCPASEPQPGGQSSSARPDSTELLRQGVLVTPLQQLHPGQTLWLPAPLLGRLTPQVRRVHEWRLQGSRAQGSGCMIQGLRAQGHIHDGLRTTASARAQGSGFKVQGSGFRAQGSGFRRVTYMVFFWHNSLGSVPILHP